MRKAFAVALQLETKFNTTITQSIQLEIVEAASIEEALGKVLLKKENGILGAFKAREILIPEMRENDEKEQTT